jgi:type IX secretion system PorP/SprF family membrane protein
MNKGILSFGLQAGAKFFNLNDLEEFLDDPLFNVTDIRKVTPDANFGIYYYSDRFFAGLSSKQLFENEYGVIRGEDGKTTYMRLARHMYGMAGAAFPLTQDMALRPSVLAKYVRNAPFQVEGNLSLVFDDKLLIGASYRTEKTVVLMTEIRIAKQIRLGYSFDMYLNELQGQSKGSHEIRIGLDFELFQTRMLSPRYFF